MEEHSGVHMGYYKDQDIERLHTELQAEWIEQEAERIAASFLQPSLGPELSEFPEAKSLLDYIRVFNGRLLTSTLRGPSNELSADAFGPLLFNQGGI
jgi:hypothetical protein